MVYEVKHIDSTINEVRYLDSGCSSHITGLKLVFKEFDKSQKIKVRPIDVMP